MWAAQTTLTPLHPKTVGDTLTLRQRREVRAKVQHGGVLSPFKTGFCLSVSKLRGVQGRGEGGGRMVVVEISQQ